MEGKKDFKGSEEKEEGGGVPDAVSCGHEPSALAQIHSYPRPLGVVGVVGHQASLLLYYVVHIALGVQEEEEKGGGGSVRRRCEEEEEEVVSVMVMVMAVEMKVEEEEMQKVMR
jgi:threonine dehydrogenase-like Zn-dependent dehydrogenase